MSRKGAWSQTRCPCFLLWCKESREEQRELAKVFLAHISAHTFTLLEFCESPVFNGQHHLKCHLRVHKLTNIFSKNATFLKAYLETSKKTPLG